MTDIVERLEAHMGKAEIKDVLPDCREGAAEIRRLREALTLAEDVLSRAPFSNSIWPNGMHPYKGIRIIRAALPPSQRENSDVGKIERSD